MSPQLPVRELDRSIDFNTNKSGFRVNFRYEDFYAGISKDGFSIHLKSGSPSLEESKNKKENENLDILFSVDNIENLFEELFDHPSSGYFLPVFFKTIKAGSFFQLI